MTSYYNEKNCKILEELFELWVTSDQLASHVAFELKGFEYLLERIGLNELQLQHKDEAKITDIK